MTRLRLLGVMRGRDLDAAGASALDDRLRLDLGDPADLALVAAPSDEAAPRRTRRRILAHARELEALLAHGPVAPMRFGCLAEDPETARRTLRPRAEEFAGLLERFAGRAEFAIRVEWREEEALAALARAEPRLQSRGADLNRRGPEAHDARLALGREVAERLAARRAEAEALLLARLGELAHDVHRLKPESPATALRAALLATPAAESDLLARAEAAAAESGFGGDAPPLIRWIGPGPAFSFCAADPIPAAAG